MPTIVFAVVTFVFATAQISRCVDVKVVRKLASLLLRTEKLAEGSAVCGPHGEY